MFLCLCLFQFVKSIPGAAASFKGGVMDVGALTVKLNLGLG